MKDRLMLSLGSNAFGGHKFKLHLVCHPENSLALKSIIQGYPFSLLQVRSKAWVTVALFEDLFINCFIPETDKYCRGNNIPFKVVLVVNNASCYAAHIDNFSSNKLAPSSLSLSLSPPPKHYISSPAYGSGYDCQL